MRNGIAFAIGCNASLPALRVASFASAGNSGISSTRDRPELSCRSRRRAASPARDFSCAKPGRFFPTDRNPPAASFCARRNNRTPLSKQNNAHPASPSPCARHRQISRRLRHALCAVPSTSGMPFPIRVCAMMNCGFPLSRSFATSSASRNCVHVLPVRFPEHRIRKL